MKKLELYSIIMVFLALMSACGSQDQKDESPQPITVNTHSPSGSQPDAVPATQPASTGANVPGNNPYPEYPETPAVNQTSPYPQSPDTNVIPADANTPVVNTDPQDAYNVPYDPNAAVPYAEEYGMQVNSQYDPQSEYYWAEISSQVAAVSQPYPTFVPQYQVPYLNERYSQHRAITNYGPSFQRVRVGRDNWDRTRYDHAKRGLDRSRQWVNRDVFVQINRNMDNLRSRNFRSPHGTENQIRSAISRRDHREAVRLHDRFLDETRGQDFDQGGRQGSRNDDDRRSNDSRRDNDRRPGRR